MTLHLRLPLSLQTLWCKQHHTVHGLLLILVAIKTFIFAHSMLYKLPTLGLFILYIFIFSVTKFNQPIAEQTRTK